MSHQPRCPSVSSDEVEKLLTSHQRPLLSYIGSLVRNHHEAEDVLQRVNLILWQKRTQFEAGSNFRAWSFSIARLEIFNHLRKQRSTQRVLSNFKNDESLAVCDPDEEGHDEAILGALKDCIARLSPRDQELLFVRYFSERPLKEYAENLSCSHGTLKARLFQIRETLKKGIRSRLRESCQSD